MSKLAWYLGIFILMQILFSGFKMSARTQLCALIATGLVFYLNGKSEKNGKL
jgi:hypothetical protein